MSITIRDMQGNVVGYQDRDGTVRDRNQKKIGSINRHNGTVCDNHNQEVGFIDGDGNVIDRYRRRVGKLGKDGVVEDWHGIALYTGSAAPLLLDFDKAEGEAAEGERFDFDQVARQAAGSGTTEFEQHTRQAMSPRERLLGALMQEGFVSPSVLGCLGLIGAVAVGLVILFLFQNPSVFSRPAATPTRSILVAPSDANATNATALPDDQTRTTPTPQPPTGKVNTELLNLRAGPATTFAKIDGLKQDTIVVLTGRTQDSLWLKVTVPIIGKDGWVAAEYISTNIDVSTLPVVQAPAQ
ncbi:MAG: SH3 domain-containing protein [Chloroflexi bacterium]|nr:SH3 domain-containing protein [Chloroflexota bacterium]